VTILDANVLLYAYNADAPQHPAAARWLAKLLESGEVIALPWITIWAFIRIATNSRIWPNPLPAKQVFAIVEKWISQPGVIVLEPGPRHTEILKGLIIDQSVTGAMVTDAVLAALALENGAFLASADQDFRRFPTLQWRNPFSQ
jgi:toxin-antitoxin system PIN domain toxin